MKLKSALPFHMTVSRGYQLRDITTVSIKRVNTYPLDLPDLWSRISRTSRIFPTPLSFAKNWYMSRSSACNGKRFTNIVQSSLWASSACFPTKYSKQTNCLLASSSYFLSYSSCFLASSAGSMAVTVVFSSAFSSSWSFFFLFLLSLEEEPSLSSSEEWWWWRRWWCLWLFFFFLSLLDLDRFLSPLFFWLSYCCWDEEAPCFASFSSCYITNYII